MNVAIFYNPGKDQAKSLASQIVTFLKEHKIKVFAEEQVAQEIDAHPLSAILPTEINFKICLGGDGSILRLVHRHPEIIAPIFGINMGSLGFLADTPITETFTTLKDLLAGEYSIEKRVTMEGITSKGDKCFAVNDIVIHRAQNPSLVELAISVDGRYFNTFSADGVIFATPTGSTAYSLAAGGPILTPELNAFVITPICAHTISNRPIVLMPEREIKVEYTSKNKPVDVIYDGFTNAPLLTGDSISIKRSPELFHVVRMNYHDSFETLRTKLAWTGKVNSRR